MPTIDMSSAVYRKNRLINILQSFSIPLIVGAFVAMIVANGNPELYHQLVHNPVYELIGLGGDHVMYGDHVIRTLEENGDGDLEVMEHAPRGWPYYFTLHFLVNDLFMVVFFGIAAKEITESCLPGGALNPISKAINPLLGTLGGVLGPIGVFLLLNRMFGEPAWSRGWGIPTATDIALAWLLARIIFGAGHPAISYLLLLAVADDGIGLGIIAIGYPDPHNPADWMQALWILPGMLSALLFRKLRVQSWIPYILVGGCFSWHGLHSAHLHPALALVFIVPFIPGPRRDVGFFEEESDFDEEEQRGVRDPAHAFHRHSPLERFEHDLKLFVDLGLFFFSFANAGVPLAGINDLTWIILMSLILGKTLGITLFAWIAMRLGFSLPARMHFNHLVMAGFIAGLGLTVALFISGQAFPNPEMQDAAKMGAVFSGLVFVLAFGLKRLLRIRP